MSISVFLLIKKARDRQIDRYIMREREKDNVDYCSMSKSVDYCQTIESVD